MIEIVPATLPDYRHVVRNIRAYDRMEIEGAGVDLSLDLEYSTLLIAASAPLAWSVLERGVPIAAYGVARDTPWVWHAWAFGTDRFVRAVPAITKSHAAIRRQLTELGVTRLEVRSHVDHDLSHGWLAGPMEFQREGTLRRYGMDGSDYVLYSYTDL